MKYVYTILFTLFVFCFIVLKSEPVITWVGYLAIPTFFCLLILYIIFGKDKLYRFYAGIWFLMLSIALFIEYGRSVLTYGNSITSLFDNSWILLGKFLS